MNFLDDNNRHSLPLEPNFLLANLVNSCKQVAALQADSIAPTNPKDKSHFECFVKSHKRGHIYELDGDKKGQVDKGVVLGPEEDNLTVWVLIVAKEFIQRERDENLTFGVSVQLRLSSYSKVSRRRKAAPAIMSHENSSF